MYIESPDVPKCLHLDPVCHIGENQQEFIYFTSKTSNSKLFVINLFKVFAHPEKFLLISGRFNYPSIDLETRICRGEIQHNPIFTHSIQACFLHQHVFLEDAMDGCVPEYKNERKKKNLYLTTEATRKKELKNKLLNPSMIAQHISQSKMN